MTDFAKHCLFILGAGPLTIRAYEEARRLGIYTVAIDRFETTFNQRPGPPIGSDRRRPQGSYPALCEASDSVICDLKDQTQLKETMAFLVKRKKEQGFSKFAVMTCGADLDWSVATAAFQIGAPGLNPAVAERCFNKRLMHNWLDRVGFSARARLAHRSERAHFFPVVIKPLDQCASRGVEIVNSESELQEALFRIGPYSKSGILLEEYLEGSKHTCETIVEDGDAKMVSIIDTHYISRRYPCETGLNSTTLSEENQIKLGQFAQEVADALGVEWGPFKVDVNFDGTEFKLIECTARLSGGFHCQYASPVAYGTQEIEAVIRQACGDPLDEKLIYHRWNRGAAVRCPFTSFGRIVSYNQDRPTSVDGVDQAIMTRAIGDPAGPYRNSADRVGFVLAHGKTTEEAIRNADLGVKHFQIETDDYTACPLCGSDDIEQVRRAIDEPIEFYCGNCLEELNYFPSRSIELYDRF